MRCIENDKFIADTWSRIFISCNAEVLQTHLNIKNERHCQVVGGPHDETDS